MTRSKRGRRTLACLIPGVLCLVVGCGGTSPATHLSGEGKSRGEDPLVAARETLRKATDASTFREALQQINVHLGQDPEASVRLQKANEERDRVLPPERLRELFGLEGDDLEYVRAPTFQPLDAHYLMEAFELRDAARGLEVQDLSKLQQADRAFQWVMRQVTLRVESDKLVPPQFVLLSGQGTAAERALVFLGLLRQLNLEGCLITVPGTSPNRPRFWAVGVLIEDKGHGEIYVFDTRLGVPMPGPGGKGIATLAQLQAQPDLLRQLTVDKESPYDIAPEQVREAAVHLACPLSALAPRMKLLADMVSGYDRLQLAVDIANLLPRLEAAARSKVRGWSPPTTPGRALRSFVSAEEGGVDRSGGAQSYVRKTLPWALVGRNLRDQGMEDLPAPAEQELRQFAGALYARYAVNPHDDLVRGRLDEATRRLVQALAILREFDEALLPEAEFRKEVAAWRERVKQAYLSFLRQEPEAQTSHQGLWSEDQHLQALLAGSVDERERQKYPKKVLSFLVVRSVASPLRNEASYELALCWQEKAERLETQRLRQARAGKDDERLNAWLNVQDWWRKYADQYPFTAASVSSGVARLNDFRNPLEAVAFWVWLFRDLRMGCHARLLQAHGLEKSGKPDSARVVLDSLVVDLAALRKDPHLTKTLRIALNQVEGLTNAAAQSGGPVALLADLHAQLSSLARDLGPGGSFSWMRAAALYRLGRLTDK